MVGVTCVLNHAPKTKYPIIACAYCNGPSLEGSIQDGFCYSHIPLHNDYRSSPVAMR